MSKTTIDLKTVELTTKTVVVIDYDKIVNALFAEDVIGIWMTDDQQNRLKVHLHQRFKPVHLRPSIRKVWSEGDRTLWRVELVRKGKS